MRRWVMEAAQTDMMIERVERLVRPLLASQGLELVEVRYSGGRHRGQGTLRIFIDKSGGVTAADCGHASQILSTALDVENIIQQRYILEVSSPGLDRPLTTPSDFQRHRGRLVRMETVTRGTLTGRILEAGLEGIALEIQGTGRLVLAPAEVRSARLEVEWTHES